MPGPERAKSSHGAPGQPARDETANLLLHGVWHVTEIVAAERLVAAVPAERNRDVSSRLARDVPRRKAGGICERLVESPNQSVEGLVEAWRDRMGEMLRLVAPGRLRRQVELVVRLLSEPHGRRDHGLRVLLGHARDDEAGIDTA